MLFPDATCVAVDSGPAVVNRAAARVCGRTAAQRSAIVIDRFFETKQAALDWSNSHPQFMTVRIAQPGSRNQTQGTVAALDDSEYRKQRAGSFGIGTISRADSASRSETGSPKTLVSVSG